MSNTVESTDRETLLTRIAAASAAVVVAAFMVVSLAGGPAQANPKVASQSFTCPGALANAYDTFSTVAGCTATTTVAESSLTLTVSYHSGTLKWRACGSRSLEGTTVQLYIDGQAMTQEGGSATVGGNGCTPDLSVDVCLSQGNHNATAMDGPNQASQSFTVDSSGGCSSAAVLSGSSGLAAGGSTNNGHLAFTGSNVVLLLLAAGLLGGSGLSIIRLARQRRPIPR